MLARSGRSPRHDADGALAGLLAILHDEPWQIIVAMAGLSVGVGFSFASMAALVTEAVDPTETGIATGINTVMRTSVR